MVEYNNLNIVVDKFVINSKERMLGVVKLAIDNMVTEAQTPAKEGGRIRVDTGFLRASGAGALNAPPVGPTKGDRKGKYTWDGEALNKVIAKMKLGDVFYWGWTAHYAKIREVYDGYLETALQKWQTHVDNAVQYFRNEDMTK